MTSQSRFIVTLYVKGSHRRHSTIDISLGSGIICNLCLILVCNNVKNKHIPNGDISGVATTVESHTVAMGSGPAQKSAEVFFVPSSVAAHCDLSHKAVRKHVSFVHLAATVLSNLFSAFRSDE